jgi:hypothetical protein
MHYAAYSLPGRRRLKACEQDAESERNLRNNRTGYMQF